MLQGFLDSDGAGRVHLPAAAGTLQDPPVVACYVADEFSSVAWLIVATSSLTGTCGMVAHVNHIDVAIIGSPPNWVFRIAVVY